MTHVTCRLTAKNRDQLQNPTLVNRVWATFTFFTWSIRPARVFPPNIISIGSAVFAQSRRTRRCVRHTDHGTYDACNSRPSDCSPLLPRSIIAKIRYSQTLTLSLTFAMIDFAVADLDHQVVFVGGPNTRLTNPRWRGPPF